MVVPYEEKNTVTFFSDMSSNLVRDTLHAFCVCVLKESDDSEMFVDVRKEVQTFLGQMWPDDGAILVREYLSVPNHMMAVNDLDYKRFSTTPLTIHAHALHIFHILEIFSRTNATRYASVWLRLVELYEVSTDIDRTVLHNVRVHLEKSNQSVSQMCAVDPTTGQEMDAFLQGVMGSVPGLQTLVQQIMNDSQGENGMANILGNIQKLIQPILSQAVGETDPALHPAISQIIGGFSALTSALGGRGDIQQPSNVEE